MKIEPVTKMRRTIERERQIDVKLLDFANRRKKEAGIPTVGIIKGRVKNGSV